jgi:CheY-like chemotaxis protein
MSIQEKKVILLVEEDVCLSLINKEMLEYFDYKVIIAPSGESALNTIINKKEIDLILMDIRLGRGLNGLDTAQEILKHKDIPIVFMIDYVENNYFEKLKGIVCYGCIYKSSGEFVLRASIEIAINLFHLNKISKLSHDPLTKCFINSSAFVLQKTEPVPDKYNPPGIGCNFSLD